MNPRDQVLEVWGDFACFTRPEMKVERFSYPIITPSAARGIYDAIYRKPQLRWQITRIEVLKPVRFIALRRNEVKDKVNVNAVGKWIGTQQTVTPLWADATPDEAGTDQKGRTQRQTMALKGVRYRLHASVHPWPGFEDGLQGMEAQFRRRAAHGKCVYQPCFGCREFPAFFELVELGAPPPSLCEEFTMDLGFMLYDVFDLSRPGNAEDEPRVSLFHAVVDKGVLKVPDYDSDEVKKPGRDG